MYCNKCGESVKENWNYCPKCQNMLNIKTTECNQEEKMEEKNKKSTNVLMYVFLFFAGLLGMAIFKRANGIFFLVSLISIVTGFIKYSNNKVIKIYCYH